MMMEDKYEIYGIQNCPFCTRATDLLSDKGERYIYFKLDSMDSVLSAKIMTDASMSTVPIIYCNGELVGGYTELRNKLENK